MRGMRGLKQGEWRKVESMTGKAVNNSRDVGIEVESYMLPK